MQNQFLITFEELIRNIIIPYFIEVDEFSNTCKELNGLMLCCRTIEKTFKRNFKSRFRYIVGDISELKLRLNVFSIVLQHNIKPFNSLHEFENSSTSIKYGIM